LPIASGTLDPLDRALVEIPDQAAVDLIQPSGHDRAQRVEASRPELVALLAQAQGLAHDTYAVSVAMPYLGTTRFPAHRPPA
jgi:hypothetical protein